MPLASPWLRHGLCEVAPLRGWRPFVPQPASWCAPGEVPAFFKEPSSSTSRPRPQQRQRRQQPPQQKDQSHASLFDAELRKCSDAAAVLRCCATTRMRLGPRDLRAFMERFVELERFPRAGAESHAFLRKAEGALSSAACTPEVRHFTLVSFARLKSRPGALLALRYCRPHFDVLGPEELAETIWALSAVPAPPPEIASELVGLAQRLAADVDGLPVHQLYRSVYGLARTSRGEGCAGFRAHAERAAIEGLKRTKRPGLTPTQLVRLLWAFARLGSEEGRIFRRLEFCIRHVIDLLSTRELEALYGVLTELRLQDQWRLIFDIEQALESKHAAEGGDPITSPRKRAFKKKWKRQSLSHTAAR